jgi:hypothetical protein
VTEEPKGSTPLIPKPTIIHDREPVLSTLVTFLSKIHLYIQIASSGSSLWMEFNILEEHAEDGGSMFLQKKFTLSLKMQVSIYKTITQQTTI